jgi:hypothetical protein
MPANYVLLEKVVIGATGADTVTFNNIPQTGYTDLKLVISSRQNLAQIYGVIQMFFNNTASGLSYRILQGYNGSASSSGQTNVNGIYGVFSDNGANSTANTFSSLEFYIPNYASSNFKSVSYDQASEGNATNQGYAILGAGLWSSTNPITSLTITTGGSGASFIQNASFYLYGVAKLGTTPAIAPKAAGGDIIDTDGTYWYHTFLSSGTFTPQINLTCDYLVVAGAGGGGNGRGGGGGAGGLRSTVTATGGGGSLESALALSGNTNYTVTIGAGGAGNTTGSARGVNGSNSSFTSISTVGGGGGGTAGSGVYTGSAGGSGGGAGDDSSGPFAGGAGTANQGFAGGASTNIPAQEAGGGGGGAGAVGANAVSSSGGKGGNGGNGVSTIILGTSTAYAGGGGGGSGYLGSGISGGTGGSGGGGAGALYNVSDAVAGAVNKGSGGGGGTYANTTRTNGANGGSGIVIVRYLVA